MKAKATSYAAALFELARAEGEVKQIDRDFRLIVETVSKHLKLKDSLTNPQLSATQKQGIVDEIFDSKVSAAALSFLRLLVGMGRVEYIRLVSEELTRLVQIEEKKAIADVITAIELDEEMTVKIARKLSELTGKEVKLRTRVDESIIGGIIIRMDGKLLDGSIRSQFEELKEKMISGKTRG